MSDGNEELITADEYAGAVVGTAYPELYSAAEAENVKDFFSCKPGSRWRFACFFQTSQ